MPDPIPRWLRWCAWSFLPIEQRPSPCGNRVGAPRYPFNRFRREPNFGAAGFVSVLLASTFACRTDGSDLRDARGRRGVYIPAEHGLLPHHAWDMLITRIDQLVMGRLALPQLLSLVGCSSRIRLSEMLTAAVAATVARKELSESVTPTHNPVAEHVWVAFSSLHYANVYGGVTKSVAQSTGRSGERASALGPSCNTHPNHE